MLIRKSIVYKERKKSVRVSAWCAGICILGYLVMLSQVYTRVSLNDIELLKKKDFFSTDGNTGWKIDVNSVLNPLAALMCTKAGFIDSKRFVPGGIKKTKTTVRYIAENEYILEDTRDLRMDELDHIKGDNYDIQYINDYNKTIALMFPSMHGYASIWSDREDSFFSFINRVDVKKHKYKILASLLLLAEGVNVPLAINESQNKKTLVLGNRFIFFKHVRIDLKSSKSSITSKEVGDNTRLLDVVDVISFFINNRASVSFKKKQQSDTLDDYSKFMKGMFINSPVFLIQMYIFNCMKNSEETMLLVQEVFNMLQKNHADKESAALFNKYFTRAEQSSDWNNIIKEVENIVQKELKNDVVFLWNHTVNLSPTICTASQEKSPNSLNPKNPKAPNGLKSQVDSGMDVMNKYLDSYLANNINIDKNNALYFIDYIETVLLSLFCCVTQDCDGDTYTTRKLCSASEGLKSFFEKHQHMYGVVSNKMHEEWNNVVKDLKDPKIWYLRKDCNQLAPGLINIMYTFAKVAGIYQIKQIDNIAEKIEQLYDEKIMTKINTYKDMLCKNPSKTEQKEIISEIEKIIGEKIDNEETLPYEYIYSIIEKQNNLMAELTDAINKYFSSVVVEKYAMNKNLKIVVAVEYKETSKNERSDLFGTISITHMENVSGVAGFNENHGNYSRSFSFLISSKWGDLKEAIDKGTTQFVNNAPVDNNVITTEKDKLYPNCKKCTESGWFINWCLRLCIQASNNLSNYNSSSFSYKEKTLMNSMEIAKLEKQKDILLLSLMLRDRNYKREFALYLSIDKESSSLLQNDNILQFIKNNVVEIPTSCKMELSDRLIMHHIQPLNHKYSANTYVNTDITRNITYFTKKVQRILDFFKQWDPNTETEDTNLDSSKKSKKAIIPDIIGHELLYRIERVNLNVKISLERKIELELFDKNVRMLAELVVMRLTDSIYFLSDTLNSQSDDAKKSFLIFLTCGKKPMKYMNKILEDVDKIRKSVYIKEYHRKINIFLIKIIQLALYYKDTANYEDFIKGCYDKIDFKIYDQKATGYIGEVEDGSQGLKNIEGILCKEMKQPNIDEFKRILEMNYANDKATNTDCYFSLSAHVKELPKLNHNSLQAFDSEMFDSEASYFEDTNPNSPNNPNSLNSPNNHNSPNSPNDHNSESTGFDFDTTDIVSSEVSSSEPPSSEDANQKPINPNHTKLKPTKSKFTKPKLTDSKPIDLESIDPNHNKSKPTKSKFTKSRLTDSKFTKQTNRKKRRVNPKPAIQKLANP
ncbi:uncharacterized protein NESG_01096 [Nematocida ausubeli]|uniref:Uncharacterized protein n=1 Tax=Nematocida ausubeli (strain ATCC PRA-371 / ERTm2) TaxID=1913371 RepID=A0A086J1G7_NEMA1|nr:uncharacterized protein NESG_01096 [Nematocida ausubeli]KFG25985.1 hypothetical protein NESG_01096 [Nematocida ausubeli]